MPYNRIFDQPKFHQHLNPLTPSGLAKLDCFITRQATLISYLDDFKLLMHLSLAAMPLVFLPKRGAGAEPDDHSLAIE